MDLHRSYFDDFFLQYDYVNIAHLKTGDQPEVKDFVVHANIDAVLADTVWWYWACRCSKKAVEDEEDPGIYYCRKCNTHVTKVTRKFLLKLRIVDETDCLTVVLFDQTARLLIGKTSEEVYVRWKEDEGRDYLANELLGLKGRGALFRIESEGSPRGKFDVSYRVKNVTEDIEMIKSYNAKWDTRVVLENNQKVLLLEDTSSNVSEPATCDVEGLSEDLIVKFDQSASDSCTLGSTKNTIDITRDTDEKPPCKRKSPADSGSFSVSLPLKTIKQEK